MLYTYDMKQSDKTSKVPDTVQTALQGSSVVVRIFL